MALLNFTPTSALADLAFGLDLLSLFGSKIDVVGVFNGTAQVFEKARPMKATVRETSKIMEHPVESGVILSDHHIINPVEIDLPLVIPSIYYVATYQQIKSAFVNATSLSVKTPVGVFRNMVIADMPHEEDPEMYNVITMGLHLKQVLIVFPNGSSTGAFAENYSPADPTNSSTVQSGLQSAQVIGGAALTTATAAFGYANLLSRF